MTKWFKKRIRNKKSEHIPPQTTNNAPQTSADAPEWLQQEALMPPKSFQNASQKPQAMKIIRPSKWITVRREHKHSIREFQLASSLFIVYGLYQTAHA